VRADPLFFVSLHMVWARLLLPLLWLTMCGACERLVCSCGADHGVGCDGLRLPSHVDSHPVTQVGGSQALDQLHAVFLD